MCIASFILALTGAVISSSFLFFPPLFLVIAAPFALLSLILGITGLAAAKRNHEAKGLGIWGVFLSSLGLVFCLVELVFLLLVGAAMGMGH